MHPIPVFLISYNRPDTLQQTISGLNHLSTPLDIIIHDNGSDDDQTILLLNELEKNGILVFRSHKLNHPDELNNVQDTISNYFGSSVATNDYIVSDCDIDLSIASNDAIEIYRDLLYAFDDVKCCGPMLRVHDIPKEYPLYAHVMNRHIDQFWGKIPNIIEINSRKVAVQPAFIDTTFAIHKKNELFTRLKFGLRVYNPFEARHLDWYITDTNSSYHHKSNSNIAHWNNSSWFENNKNVKLQFNSYNIVESDVEAGLSIKSVEVDF